MTKDQNDQGITYIIYSSLHHGASRQLKSRVVTKSTFMSFWCQVKSWMQTKVTLRSNLGLDVKDQELGLALKSLFTSLRASW